ncbi:MULTISPECIES: hypothetical protein [unclassified Sulfitobacter]|jgi:hypothetical protein|uniref:hypothetical protein n=1 Tax=unclassified Sulfitobacter TaxID=196795 RepID=UPI001592EDFF|nr:hypothetical protein [Sulfitobacter sp. HGT1]MBQ0804739.1 hypothetical protein [Sulfitobacter sp.]
MLDQKDVHKKAQRVRREMQAKLGVQGRDLDHALRKAGRRLPGDVRKQGNALARAEFFAQNPKMARRLDAQSVETAFDRVMAHLESIDAVEDRRDRLLGVAGAVAFNLLFVVVGFVVFLWWRGYV